MNLHAHDRLNNKSTGYFFRQESTSSNVRWKVRGCRRRGGGGGRRTGRQRRVLEGVFFIYSNGMKIEDSVFIITGGASGLGQACARLFISKGARGVGIFDLNDDAGEGIYSFPPKIHCSNP